MAVFAIGDPHLSRANPKPMDIFGPRWENHAQRLFDNWQRVVGPGDIVLVPGDISWAMTEEEALLDLQAIDALPGRKIMIQGNHDYWWQSISRLRRLPLQSIQFIQNDHVMLGEIAVCGTRGWILPTDRTWHQDAAHNAKILAREVARLNLSLESARRGGAREIICMMHYPPCPEDGSPSEFTAVLDATPGLRLVLYGHVHGPGALERSFNGERGGVSYRMVACDAVEFTPVRVWA